MHYLMRFKMGMIFFAVVLLNTALMSCILQELSGVSIFIWYSGAVSIVLAGVLLRAFKQTEPETLEVLDGKTIVTRCAYCGDFRDMDIKGEESWVRDEYFIANRLGILTFHSVCKRCLKNNIGKADNDKE